MSKIETLLRYNLIVNRVRKSPATFKEISDYLRLESELQGYNFDISARTFKRDLDDIRSLYSINIVYDARGKVYRINVDDYPDVNNRMLEAFDTFNALNLASGFSKYIHFENRKPHGTENLYGLLHAIKNTQVIIFNHLKYWTGTMSTRKVLPYALKEFKGRWYLVARDESDGRIKTFGLDRMSGLEITKKRFVFPRDLDVEALYRDSFGIINPMDGVAERVVLSFDADQGKYIKSFPLHQSQEVLVDNEDELRISLCVHITHDLIMEVLSYGCRVRVLEPESLRGEVLAHFRKGMSLYE